METRLIVAIIRRAKLDAVEEKLQQVGIERMNVSSARGYGEFRNYYTQDWMDDEVRIDIVTRQHKVDEIASAIMEAAHTGSAGDGVIAIVPIDKLFLIRTKAEATPQNFWPEPDR